MQRQSSPEGPLSRCLDPTISVSPSAAGCGGQDPQDPYGINLRSAPRCCGCGWTRGHRTGAVLRVLKVLLHFLGGVMGLWHLASLLIRSPAPSRPLRWSWQGGGRGEGGRFSCLPPPPTHTHKEADGPFLLRSVKHEDDVRGRGTNNAAAALQRDAAKQPSPSRDPWTCRTAP